MKQFLPLLLMVVLMSSAASPASSDDSPKPGTQTAARLKKSVDVELQYLLYLPKDYEQKPAWPLVLFLHGAGERGTNLDLVKIHGPPKMIAAGKEFPAIVASPQCPADQSWEPLPLLALLDDLAAHYKVDPARVYVTGLSMGGFGTWRLGALEPQRFAALAPICGGGEVFWARTLKDIPTWIFHGDQDKAVPVERSTQMAEALKKAGGEPKYTIYEGVGHDSWTPTYDNPEFWDWLFAQKTP